MTNHEERELGCAVGACGVAVGSMVRAVVGTSLGARGSARTIWSWGDLVGATESVCVVSEMQGTEVRGRVIMGDEV